MIRRSNLTRTRWADYSPCERYRYALFIRFDDTPHALAVVGLNPSTATELEDDPTIRRCIGFARADGCGALIMLNLFAWRATDPRDLVRAREAGHPIVGSENYATLRTQAIFARRVVVAWGAHPLAVGAVPTVLDTIGREVYALGVTADGSPKHPLARGRHRIPDTARPALWTPSGGS